jgi:hypothetical protein
MTRAEGYRIGISKEKYALATFEDFMSHYQIESTFVTDKDENWQYGDYKLANGKYIEVKGQPVNPDKHPVNFVELGEITSKDYHRSGFSSLKEMLGVDDLESKSIRNNAKKTWETFGNPECFSFSLKSLSNGSTWAYVNSFDNIIYIYSASSLKNGIINAIKNERALVRGAGKSNEDTIAAFVSLPVAIWRKIDNKWVYTGTGDEKVILQALQG